MRISKLIFFFGGRGCQDSSLPSLFVQGADFLQIVVPQGKEWYVAPNGRNDQKNAIETLNDKAIITAEYVEKQANKFGYELDEVNFAGFSAGAVLAIKTSMFLKNIGGVISCSGCILDPENTPPANGSETNYILLHGTKDNVFNWNERYLPTKNSLINNGYKVQCFEGEFGHEVDVDFLSAARKILASKFSYIQ